MPGSHIPRKTLFRIGVLCLALLSVSGCKDQSNPSSSTPLHLKITSLVPAYGRHGAHIVVVGQQFSSVVDSNQVYFFGTSGVNVLAHIDSVAPKAAPTNLYIAVPDSASSGRVRVVVNRDTIVSDSIFVVEQGPAPVITAIVPSSGTPASFITIRGSYFETSPANIHVWFGTVAAVLRKEFVDSLQVIVPEGANSGPIMVVMNYDTLFTAPFTVISFGHSISGFTPESGWPGTAVTITGSKFLTDTSGLKVAFGGIPAVVKSVTTSQIVAVVPPGAITAQISVSYYGDKTSSASEFKVTPAPRFGTCTIEIGNVLMRTSFSSSSGSVRPDTQLATWTNEFNAALFSGNPQSDTLLFRSSYTTYGTVPCPSCFTSDTVSMDSGKQTLNFVGAFSHDSVYQADDPIHYVTWGDLRTVRAVNIPLHGLPDGRVLGEVRGDSMVASVITVNFEHNESSDFYPSFSSHRTTIFKMTDSSYLRITLSP